MMRPSGAPVALAGSTVLIWSPLANAKSALGSVPKLMTQATASRQVANRNKGKKRRTW